MFNGTWYAEKNSDSVIKNGGLYVNEVYFDWVSSLGGGDKKAKNLGKTKFCFAFDFLTLILQIAKKFCYFHMLSSLSNLVQSFIKSWLSFAN